MYNKCVFVGRMTKDAEQVTTKTGIVLAKFGLAVNNKYKKDGQVVEETMFIDCTCFSATAENMLKYTKKGMLILVEGKLKLDTWQDANTGQNRYKHTLTVDVVKFLEFKNNEADNTATAKNVEYKPNYVQDEPPF